MTLPARLSGKSVGIAAALLCAVFVGFNAVGSKQLFAAPPIIDPVGLFVARGAWSLPLFVGLAIISRPRPMPNVSRGDVGKPANMEP
jgi:drug/metabolite transporter (DMT)-like permease